MRALIALLFIGFVVFLQLAAVAVPVLFICFIVKWFFGL